MLLRLVVVLALLLAACSGGSGADDVSLDRSGLASENELNAPLESGSDEPAEITNTDTDPVQSFFKFAGTRVGFGNMFVDNARLFGVAEQLGLPVPSPSASDEELSEWAGQVGLTLGVAVVPGSLRIEISLGPGGVEQVGALYGLELPSLLASVGGRETSLYLDAGPRWEDRLTARGWIETEGSWQSNDSRYTLSVDGNRAVFTREDRPTDEPGNVVGELKDFDRVVEALLGRGAYTFTVSDAPAQPATLPPAHVTAYGAYFDESAEFVTLLVVGYSTAAEAAEAAAGISQLIAGPDHEWAADGEVKTDGSFVLIELPSGTEADCIAGNEACNPRRFAEVQSLLQLDFLLDS
ncbi:MAG: hypothetical protein GXP35_08930 [Actinobacteria bacterium]|nr:hypothetical protein [Actinomycetota bacterium]